MVVRRNEALLDVGLLLVRLAVGIVFVFHGSQKLFGAFDGPGISGFADGLEKMGIPAPMLGAILAACAEFFGGLALLTGIGVRIAAIPLIVTMAVAVFKVHWGSFSLQKGGIEYAMTLGLVVLGLALTGPGRLVLWRPGRGAGHEARSGSDASGDHASASAPGEPLSSPPGQMSG